MKRCLAETDAPDASHFLVKLGVSGLLCCACITLNAQTNSYTDSTRPTISSDAAIQQKGVLQIESGYDGYFAPFDQTEATGVYYALTNWLRLDGAVPGWRSTDAGGENKTSGLGNGGIGAKVILFHQGKSRTIPGFAVQYSETFASASERNLRSRRHEGTLIASQKFGKWEAKLNGTLVADCYHPFGCGLRGQGVAGVTYSLTDNLTLASDLFGETVSVDAPAGIYSLLGVTYKLTRAMAVNSGLRFGLNSSASTVGFTVGLTVGIGGAPQILSP